MKIFLIFLVGAILAQVNGIPTQYFLPVDPISAIDPFRNENAPSCTTEDVVRLRNGVIDQKYRWRDFNVHPDKAYSPQEQQAINDAMYKLMLVIPCVNFGIWAPDSTPSGDYVRIVKGSANGCNSYVGRQGGRQDMNLQSPGCMGVGTIMHEMIHALGLHHEHNRPDRDNYVNINWENVQDGQTHNFFPVSTYEYSSFNVSYNLQSIMHYKSNAFSKNGQPTITAKTSGPIGTLGELQETDIRKLKNMYGC